MKKLLVLALAVLTIAVVTGAATACPNTRVAPHVLGR
jgi:hypothetical protein